MRRNKGRRKTEGRKGRNKETGEGRKRREEIVGGKCKGIEWREGWKEREML